MRACTKACKTAKSLTLQSSRAMKLRRLPNGVSVQTLNRMDFLLLQHELYTNDLRPRYLNPLPQQPIIVDVGANIGLWTLRMLEAYTNARVWAFEPIPALYRAAQWNVDAHSPDRQQVTLINEGIAEVDTPAVLHFNPWSTLGTSIHALHEKSFWNPDAAGTRRTLSAALADMGAAGVLPQWPCATLARVLVSSNRLVSSLTLLSIAPFLVITAIIGAALGWFTSIPVECRLRTLSHAIEEYRIPDIDLLKIDVEGGCAACKLSIFVCRISGMSHASKSTLN